MRLVALKGLTVDVNFLDDSNYDPTDHPHAPAGTGKGGQFVKKGSGGTTKSGGKSLGGNMGREEGGIPYGTAFPVNKKIHQQAMNAKDPHKAAGNIKYLANEQVAPGAASYANKVLPALEKKFGLLSGSLGKAYPKNKQPSGYVISTSAPAGGITPEQQAKINKSWETPKQEEPKQTTYKKDVDELPIPNPAGGMLIQNLYDDLKEKKSKESKINLIQSKLDTWSGPQNVAYAKALYDAVMLSNKDDPEDDDDNNPENLLPPDDPISEEDLPKAYPDSVIQKKLLDAALTGESKSEQLASLKEAAKEVPSNAPFQQKYLNELLVALGEKPAGSTPAPSAPTAPPANKNKIVSKRAKDLATLKEFDTAYDHQQNGTDAKLRKALPTAKIAWLESLPSEQQNAIKQYTGSYYSEINKALRDPENADEYCIASVNHIDDAFDGADAPAKEDIVTRRGLGRLASTQAKSDAMLAKIVKGLELGIPVTFSQRGFISTSVGSGFGSSIKLKILVKKGTPALYLNKISAHKSEQELLLRHGQQFRVLEYEKDQYGGNHKLTLVTHS